MTTDVDIVNRALQSFGSRTTVTAAELLNQTTNEAIQANLILRPYRQKLLRMAPWDCAFNYANLDYITSVPGTPENQSPGVTLWQKGIPAPPWIYEYCYPVDCLKACWIVPQFQTGFSGGVPITTAVSGFTSTIWRGPPIAFKVTIDQFVSAVTSSVVTAGTGYQEGDAITLAVPPNTSPPVGAPARIVVTSAGPGGTILNAVLASPRRGLGPIGGSYFSVQFPDVIGQGSVFSSFYNTVSNGTGATFQLTFGARADQRVILTNQEFATLAYVADVADIAAMDPLFIEAWVKVVGSGLVMALSGDKNLANMLVAGANNDIAEARKADGNEGLTVNDVIPDWIRARGIVNPGWQQGPNQAFDWGSLWTVW